MIMFEEEGFLVDSNNNKVDLSKYPLEDAKEMLGSLIECEGCINCAKCVECIDCIGCYDCHKCVDCEVCKDCYKCESCESCEACIDCCKCVNALHIENKCEIISESNELDIMQMFSNNNPIAIAEEVGNNLMSIIDKEEYSGDDIRGFIQIILSDEKFKIDKIDVIKITQFLEMILSQLDFEEEIEKQLKEKHEQFSGMID